MVQRRTNGLAIASLVLGIVAMLLCIYGFLPGIVALVLGIVALVQIGRDKAEMGGFGMAVAGVVMGAVSLVLFPIVAVIAAIAIPSLMGARTAANETAAVASLRAYAAAQNNYRRMDHDDDGVYEYAHPYVKLYTGEADEMPLMLIDDAFANASMDAPPGGLTAAKTGYLFHDLVGDEGGQDYDDGKGNLVAGHGLCAVPETHNRTGRNTFVVNIQGTVFKKDTGGDPVNLFPDVAAEGWEIAE